VPCAVEDSFESLREDRVCAWLRAKNKGMKATTYSRQQVQQCDPRGLDVRHG
jgi:hypothetical protein